MAYRMHTGHDFTSRGSAMLRHADDLPRLLDFENYSISPLRQCAATDRALRFFDFAAHAADWLFAFRAIRYSC